MPVTVTMDDNKTVNDNSGINDNKTIIDDKNIMADRPRTFASRSLQFAIESACYFHSLI
jgi:hypothetical protein